jgi:CheY-like chemotaxis protein
MSAGMAFEAMNNAGHLKKRLFVILNDNEMSIAPPVGALSSYLSRLYAGAPFQDLKAAAKGAVSFLPEPLREGAKRAKDLIKGLAVGGTLFEALGFSYVGPIDGHDMDQLLPVLRTVKARATGPMLIHVITQKGKGYAPAERARDKGHATAKFDVPTGAQVKAPSNAPSYTAVFGRTLTALAADDPRIVAVTAHAFAEDHARFLSAGFDAVIVKPVSGAALRDVLSSQDAPQGAIMDPVTGPDFGPDFGPDSGAALGAGTQGIDALRDLIGNAAAERAMQGLVTEAITLAADLRAGLATVDRLHRLAGLAGTCGAGLLAAQLSEAERALRAGRPWDHAPLLDALDAVSA